MNGATTVDMPLIESMIHNRRCVSSSINAAEQSSNKQETEGTTLGIQVMEDNNHIKTGVVKASKRQTKTRNFQDDHQETLYVKGWRI